MKKPIVYIGIAALLGLGLGYLIFGNESVSNGQTGTHQHNEVTENQMWTCSMHPQIMQEEAGACPLCGMDLIPAASNGKGLALNQIRMTENAMALADVRTSIVGETTEAGDAVISLSGKITRNEESDAVQASYFDGRIERLGVNYQGQEVRKGQLLATIYAPELVAAQQELLTAAQLKESQPALYKAVRNKLKLWKLSDAQINSIEQGGSVKENFPIYATVNGTVSEKMASEGDYVKKGQPIVRLSNLSSVWAEFDAYEQQISQFKKGQKIKVTTNAYPNKVFDAVVSFISPVLDSRTRTMTIRANMTNQDGILKPGMFVKGSVAGKSLDSNPLLVPASAVLWTGERSLVYVRAQSGEPIFEMREVLLGNQQGTDIEVTSGLEAGEEIVTHGTFTVDAAAQLQGKKSMMNKEGGARSNGHQGHSMKDNSKASKDSEQLDSMTYSQEFRLNFEQGLPTYMKLKDALVMKDVEKSAQQAVNLISVYKKLQGSTTEESSRDDLQKSIEMLRAISGNKNIEQQRAHFVLLNENMVGIASELKSFNNPVYVQYCPMADNNQGAYWLSANKEIRNPYFGALMLNCGKVTEVLGM